MNIERPGSPSATTVAPISKRRSTNVENGAREIGAPGHPLSVVIQMNAVARFRGGGLFYFRRLLEGLDCELQRVSHEVAADLDGVIGFPRPKYFYEQPGRKRGG